MQKHPLWGVDTSRWTWIHQVVAYVLFAVMMVPVVWLAGKITDWVLPF